MSDVRLQNDGEGTNDDDGAWFRRVQLNQIQANALRATNKK